MKPLSIIPILLTCLLFCSQTFSQRIFPQALPPDYNCAGCVLVILKKEEDKNIHKYNEMVEKKLIKNYEGKSIFVTPTELDTNSMYADKNIYRFQLNGEPYSIQGSSPRVTGGPGEFSYTKTALKFQFYDRLTTKGYPQMSNYASWPKTMEKIAEALNKLLKK